MLAGHMAVDGEVKTVDLSSVFEAVGKTVKGEMSQEELERLVESACPGCGSCSGLYTANTMNCLTEAMGMGLPGNGTVPAADSRRLQLARQAGEQIIKLAADNICPRDIINKESIDNAFTVDMALGGSRDRERLGRRFLPRRGGTGRRSLRVSNESGWHWSGGVLR